MRTTTGMLIGILFLTTVIFLGHSTSRNRVVDESNLTTSPEPKPQWVYVEQTVEVSLRHFVFILHDTKTGQRFLLSESGSIQPLFEIGSPAITIEPINPGSCDDDPPTGECEDCEKKRLLQEFESKAPKV